MVLVHFAFNALTDLLQGMKVHYENTIERWVRYEFNEENKLQIKAFSDLVNRIDKYLNK